MRNDATFFCFCGLSHFTYHCGKSVHSVLPRPLRKIRKIKAAEEE